MPMAGAAKFGKGVEEMVVAGDARRREKAAHGEGVDQGVVEMLVVKGSGGGKFAFAACGLLVGVSGGLRFGKGKFCGIDAELVFGSGANPGFGINGAAEVVVQVGAFGHAEKKVAKLEGILAGAFETKLSSALESGFGDGARRSLDLGEQWGSKK